MVFDIHIGCFLLKKTQITNHKVDLVFCVLSVMILKKFLFLLPMEVLVFDASITIGQLYVD